MEGDVKTQGTHLYFVDSIGTPVLVKMVCPTGITGLTGGARDQIETTCLDDEDTRTYEQGLAGTVPVSVPFNLKPREGSHQTLWDLKESGAIVDWIALLSESATPPTLAAGPVPPAGTIVPPTDRTSFAFRASIADMAIDIATNEIVRGTLTLNRSGPVTPTWYTPV